MTGVRHSSCAELDGYSEERIPDRWVVGVKVGFGGAVSRLITG